MCNNASDHVNKQYLCSNKIRKGKQQLLWFCCSFVLIIQVDSSHLPAPHRSPLLLSTQILLYPQMPFSPSACAVLSFLPIPQAQNHGTIFNYPPSLSSYKSFQNFITSHTNYEYLCPSIPPIPSPPQAAATHTFLKTTPSSLPKSSLIHAMTSQFPPSQPS